MTDLPKFNVLTTDRAIGSKGKKMENLEMESTNSRRTFLKKVAYVAPAVIVLGGLSAQAGTAPGSSVFTNKIISQGDQTQIGLETVTGHNGVVDSGIYQNTDSTGAVTKTKNYTAAEVNANDIPSLWSYFKQFFGGIA
jgi:hypothetical protein